MASNANSRETVKQLMEIITCTSDDVSAEDAVKAMEHLIAEANGQAMINGKALIDIKEPRADSAASLRFGYYMRNYYPKLSKLLSDLDLYPSNPVYNANAVAP